MKRKNDIINFHDLFIIRVILVTLTMCSTLTPSLECTPLRLIQTERNSLRNLQKGLDFGTEMEFKKNTLLQQTTIYNTQHTTQHTTHNTTHNTQHTTQQQQHTTHAAASNLVSMNGPSQGTSQTDLNMYIKTLRLGQWLWLSW